VAALGPVALEAARRSLTEVLAVFVARMITVSRGQIPDREQTERFGEARDALPRATGFVARIGAESGQAAEIQHQIGLVHAIDHLEQLGEVIDRLDDRPKIIRRSEVESVRVAVEQLLLHAASGFTESGWTGDPDSVAQESRRVADLRRVLRQDLLERTARGVLPAEASGDIIETVRWLDAIGYHTSRTLHYLRPPASAAQPPALDSSSAHRE
jgi:Na+/phosphate symporter